MKISEADRLRTYRIFVSSGDDASELRERVRRLVANVFNPSLIEHRAPVRLETDMWERTSAQRSGEEGTNALFVGRARHAHAVLSLLIDELRSGTRAEIEACLRDDEIQVCILWFIEQGATEPENEVADFLNSIRDQIYYDKTGLPHSQESWEGILRVLLMFVIRGMQQPEPAYRDQY